MVLLVALLSAFACSRQRDRQCCPALDPSQQAAAWQAVEQLRQTNARLTSLAVDLTNVEQSVGMFPSATSPGSSMVGPAGTGASGAPPPNSQPPNRSGTVASSSGSDATSDAGAELEDEVGSHAEGSQR
jgi:hypothetical protein